MHYREEVSHSGLDRTPSGWCGLFWREGGLPVTQEMCWVVLPTGKLTLDATHTHLLTSIIFSRQGADSPILKDTDRSHHASAGTWHAFWFIRMHGPTNVPSKTLVPGLEPAHKPSRPVSDEACFRRMCSGQRPKPRRRHAAPRGSQARELGLRRAAVRGHRAGA